MGITPFYVDYSHRIYIFVANLTEVKVFCLNFQKLYDPLSNLMRVFCGIFVVIFVHDEKSPFRDY